MPVTLEQRARIIADGLTAGCTRTEILADVEALRADLQLTGVGSAEITASATDFRPLMPSGTDFNHKLPVDRAL